MVIYLCGFMGSGKSSLIKYAHSKLPSEEWENWQDLDLLVIKKLGFSSVTDCFNKGKESLFRQTEQDLVKSWAEQRRGESLAVLALGGGTLNEDLLQVIQGQNENKLLWVNPGLATCLKRIFDDQTKNQSRPLASLGNEGLTRLYKERERLYSRADGILSGLSYIEDWEQLKSHSRRK